MDSGDHYIIAMEKIWRHGRLSKIPLPFLLFRIRKSERSGSLEIKTGAGIKKLDFKNGNICVSSATFPHQDFCASLTENRHLNASQVKKCQDLAKKQESSLISSLLELHIHTPSQLWRFMQDFIQEDVFPLFDDGESEYSFSSEHAWEEHEILFYISSLDFILEGVRRMTNYKIIKTNLPPPEENIQLQSPEYINQIHLSLPEIYLYHVIESQNTLQDIYRISELGNKESQKIIYNFFSLGIVSLLNTPTVNANTPDFSQVDFLKILESFNHKYAFIFKYISKEIGPAAFNILEKCMEETRPHLSTLLQNLRFNEEGRIEPGSVKKSGARLLGQDIRQLLLQDLNEILTAEVLTVKRTLGNDHEAALIKSLKKV